MIARLIDRMRSWLHRHLALLWFRWGGNCSITQYHSDRNADGMVLFEVLGWSIGGARYNLLPCPRCAGPHMHIGPFQAELPLATNPGFVGMLAFHLLKVAKSEGWTAFFHTLPGDDELRDLLRGQGYKMIRLLELDGQRTMVFARGEQDSDDVFSLRPAVSHSSHASPRRSSMSVRTLEPVQRRAMERHTRRSAKQLLAVNEELREELREKEQQLDEAREQIRQMRWHLEGR